MTKAPAPKRKNGGGPQPGSGRPPYKPTEQDRKTVEAMSASGITQEDICLVIGVTRKTLRKHFTEELDTAATKANAKIAQSLFNKAIAGDTTAAIWWTKARMRWSEKKEHELSGPNGGPIQAESTVVSVEQAAELITQLQKKPKTKA